MPTLHSRKIIIAFDGNVYTGKTTFLKQLAKEVEANYIPEHSDMLSKVILKKNYSDPYMEIHYKFMLTDKLRMIFLESGVNFLDRSFVSFSAFVFALFKCGITDIRSDYLEAFRDLTVKNQIIIPDYYVHFKADYNLAIKRFQGDKGRNTPDFLIKKDFFNYFDLFCEQWISKVGGTSCQSPDINNKKLMNNILQKKSSKKDFLLITRQIEDFLQ